ncbi:hypothetical protein QM012_008264 [Aureobasidium pullulans]|uniref:Uncharacterized protein n=1 Tax=Aureobasidium pullulans TaxID=5580 RepID=A0ABR0TJU2_AURPU
MPHLRSLELDDIGVDTDLSDRPWSRYIRAISSLIGLQHCKLRKLKYYLSISRADDLLYTTIAGHGRYTSPGDRFRLVFRDGHDSIELHGVNVGEKIKELANYVAAAEAQKLQKIASDNRVIDLVVGIIDAIEDQSTNKESALS